MPSISEMTNALVSHQNQKFGPCFRCGHSRNDHGKIKFMKLQGNTDGLKALPEKLLQCYEKRGEKFGDLDSDQDGFVEDPTYEMPADIKAIEKMFDEDPAFNLQLPE